jgi:hypothetical protein
MANNPWSADCASHPWTSSQRPSIYCLNCVWIRFSVGRSQMNVRGQVPPLGRVAGTSWSGGLLIALLGDGDHCNFGKRGVKYKLRHELRRECGRKAADVALGLVHGGRARPPRNTELWCTGFRERWREKVVAYPKYDNVAARPPSSLLLRPKTSAKQRFSLPTRR